MSLLTQSGHSVVMIGAIQGDRRILPPT